MKIAQISHTYLPHMGGIEMYINKLVCKIENKYDITILTTDMGGKQDNNVCKTFYFKAFPILMRNPFSFGLIRHLLNNKYEIMHLHNIWFFPCIEAAILKRDSKIVTTIHGAWPAKATFLTKIALYLYKPFAQLILTRSDIIIVLSVAEKNRLEKMFYIKSDKIYVITNGIFPEDVDNSKMKSVISKYKLYNKKIVLFTGRAIPDKNPDLLLETFPKVKSYIDDVIYIIAGPIDNNYRIFLNKIINKYKMEDCCIIAGEVERDELIALYKIASIFISIGSWEGLPTRLLEAMYQECSPIVYDFGGMTDVITNKLNGIIINKLEPGILAENIIMLLSDNELRKNIATNARKTVSNKHVWDRSVEKIDDLYLMATKNIYRKYQEGVK